MNATLPRDLDLAGYICNVWENRATGKCCGEIHDTLDDAFREISEGSDKFRYVETITRGRDGSLTVANLYGQALDWDHRRRRAEYDEAYRQECYTRQRRTA